MLRYIYQCEIHLPHKIHTPIGRGAHQSQFSHCIDYLLLFPKSSQAIIAMTRTRREELLQLLASGQEGLDESGQMCVLEGRLYLASLASPPTKTAGTIFLTNARAMQYQPYCADFGPFNLGERTVHIRCLCAPARAPCRRTRACLRSASILADSTQDGCHAAVLRTFALVQHQARAAALCEYSYSTPR